MSFFSLLLCLFVCLYIYRSNLGFISSSSEPTQPPATYLHLAASFLQPQCDRTVANHRGDPVHPDPSAPATPSHDCPLSADDAVDPAAAFHGAEPARPASLPLRSAHGHTICTHCPGQPGGSSKPSLCDEQWPLNLSPRPPPSSHSASD